MTIDPKHSLNKGLSVLTPKLHFVTYVVIFLCSHGASLAVKNTKGQTARDLAVSTSNDTAMKTLMSSIGQSQLDRMSKPGRTGSKSGKMNLF